MSGNGGRVALPAARVRELYYVFRDPEELATAVKNLVRDLQPRMDAGQIGDYTFAEYAPHIVVARITVPAPSDFVPIREEALKIEWFTRDGNGKTATFPNVPVSKREYLHPLNVYQPPKLPPGVTLQEAARLRDEAWAAAVNAARAAGVTNTEGAQGLKTVREAPPGAIPTVGRYTERTAAYQKALEEQMIGRWLGPAPKNYAAAGATVASQTLGSNVARNSRIARVRSAWIKRENERAAAEGRPPRSFPSVLVSLIRTPDVAAIIGQADAVLMNESIPEGRRVTDMRAYVHSAVEGLDIADADKPLVEDSIVSTLTDSVARWGRQSRPFNYDPKDTPGLRGGARTRQRKTRRRK